MKAYPVSRLKEALQLLPQKELLTLCLRLARYKKENKELLGYLLLDAHHLPQYIRDVLEEIDLQFDALPRSNGYLFKKGLRKMLREIDRYGKYTASKEAQATWLLHFCQRLKASGPAYRNNQAIQKLYVRQLQKLDDLLQAMHEDLQYDFRKQLTSLQSP